MPLSSEDTTLTSLSEVADCPLFKDCPLPGKTIERSVHVGDYRLLRQISLGHCASTYLAIGIETSQLVALKIQSFRARSALAHLSEGERSAQLTVGHVERILDSVRYEREILSQVGPPAAPRVVDRFLFRGRACLATEWIHGPTLHQFLRMACDEALFYTDAFLRDLTCALLQSFASLEQLGIAHRDVKPSNILLDPLENGQPRLVDFGMAARTRDLLPNSATIFEGTFHFASPEQLAAARSVKPPFWRSRPIDPHSSDLFSLGLLIHNLFSMKDPRPRESYLFRPLPCDKIPFPNRRPLPRESHRDPLPMRLAKFIRRCTRRRPRRRFGSALHALGFLLDQK